MAVDGYHPCVKRPQDLQYVVDHAFVGEYLDHDCRNALDRGMHWAKSQEGHHFWAQVYAGEGGWTPFHRDVLKAYLNIDKIIKEEEDLWL